MIICRDLSKLSKPLGIKSVNFRNVVPGSPDGLLTPGPPSSYLSRNTLVDPTHPATFLPRYALKKFPSFRSPTIGIQAYPQALLSKPQVAWPDPPFKKVKHLTWAERVGNGKVDEFLNGDSKDELGHVMSGLGARSIDMAMLTVLGKKVHKKAVIRNSIITRLKTAISFIVVHGADGEVVNGKLRLSFNTESKQQILHDWVYIFFPTIEIYRLPYPELVKTLRDALGTIYDSGLSMELSWRGSAQSLTAKQCRVSTGCKPIHASQPQKPNNRHQTRHARPPLVHFGLEQMGVPNENEDTSKPNVEPSPPVLFQKKPIFISPLVPKKSQS